MTNCWISQVEETSRGGGILILDTSYNKSLFPVCTFLTSFPDGFTDSMIVYKACLDNSVRYHRTVNNLKTKINKVDFDTTIGKVWKIEVHLFLNSGATYTDEKVFDWTAISSSSPKKSLNKSKSANSPPKLKNAIR